jgi:hypothetical protein
VNGRALPLYLLVAPALCVAALFTPGSWLWGVDALRYLASWGLVSLAVVAAWTLALLWSGRARAGALPSGLPPTALAALAVALLVYLLPDRTLFVGDAVLRVHAVSTGVSPDAFFPQANPLDVVTHWSVPRFLYEKWSVPPVLWHRLLGAGEAALLAVLALRFARLVAPAGAPALAVASVVFFGGWLTLFTGLGKAFTELVVLTVAVGITGLVALRGGRRRVLLCLLVAAALLFHRSALALVPAAAWVLWQTRENPNGKPRPFLDRWCWLLPVLAVLAQARRLWSSFTGVDAANFGLAPVGDRGSVLSPIHGLDLLQAFLFLVPALPLLLLRPGPASRRQETIFLWILAVPFLLMALFYLPPQGIFRDYDGIAAAGIALALVLAHRLGRGLAPGRGAVAIAILLWCALPSEWWLILQADRERALARVEQLASGPPARAALVRAHTWDFLGTVRFEAGQFEASKNAYARAVEVAPSPRYLAAWAEAAYRSGDGEQAERAYGQLLERLSEDQVRLRVLGHLGLARAAGRRGDYEAVQQHLDAVLEIEPGNSHALRLQEWLRTHPDTAPPEGDEDG